MPDYAVQAIDLNVDFDTAFAFIAEPRNLPAWANAIAEVRGHQALLRTPSGEAEVELEVRAHREHGTIDWIMRFADRSVETAYSRLVARNASRSVFSFVLLPSTAALEQLEGTLEQQSATLARELAELKRILES